MPSQFFRKPDCSLLDRPRQALVVLLGEGEDALHGYASAFKPLGGNARRELGDHAVRALFVPNGHDIPEETCLPEPYHGLERLQGIVGHATAFKHHGKHENHCWTTRGDPSGELRRLLNFFDLRTRRLGRIRITHSHRHPPKAQKSVGSVSRNTAPVKTDVYVFAVDTGGQIHLFSSIGRRTCLLRPRDRLLRR